MEPLLNLVCINRKEQVILPVEKPLINTFSIIANPLSIIQNHSESYGWLMNCFIQLVGYSSNQSMTFFDFDYRNCPYILVERLSKENINIDEIIQIIIEKITTNKYVYLIVNTKFISAYKNNSKSHDLFIFGYDLQKRIFHIADCFANGKYEYSICSFDELNNAIKFNKNENYLEGTPASLWYNLLYNDSNYNPDLWKYGIKTYDLIRLKLKKFEEGEEFDVRPFHIMFQHKIHLVRVFKYAKLDEVLLNYFVKKR